MKAKYFSIILLSSLFAGCGEDIVPETGKISGADTDGQTICLNVLAGGDMPTKGGRVLTSSEAANDVDVVGVAIYRLEEDGTIGQRVFARNLDWKDSIASLRDEQMVHINLRNAPELAATQGLDDGIYTVIATGYSSDYGLIFQPALENLSASSPITCALMQTGTGVEEIFAGSIATLKVADRKFVIDENNPVNKIVTLRRQVAGAFGYFKNIPATGFSGTPATHIRLVATDENNLIRMGAINESGILRNIVNGVKWGNIASDALFADGKKGYVVYETAIADWFPRGDVNGDGILNEKDANYNGMSGNWKVPSTLDNKISVKVGTIFCSSYVVPFLSDGTSTFELQLLAKKGEGQAAILRRWSVNNPEKQQDVLIVEENGELKAAATTETSSSYSILRNHLYTIGKKTAANPNPDNPDDVDDPEDLSKGEIVVITVNDNWEVHNRLVIKPQI